jgi:hypothetical protein
MSVPCNLSLAPGFSPVVVIFARQSRFNGFTVTEPETVETVFLVSPRFHPAKAGC